MAWVLVVLGMPAGKTHLFFENRVVPDSGARLVEEFPELGVGGVPSGGVLRCVNPEIKRTPDELAAR